MTRETEKALRALVEAARKSEAFQSYQAARQRVCRDEVLLRLLRRYEAAQLMVQRAILAGGEADAEDTEEFRRLNLLLLDSEAASDYLLSKMKYEQEISHIYENLADGLELRLPGDEGNEVCPL